VLTGLGPTLMGTSVKITSPALMGLDAIMNLKKEFLQVVRSVKKTICSQLEVKLITEEM